MIPVTDPERLINFDRSCIPEDGNENFNSTTRQKWKNFSRKSGRYAAAKVSYENRIANLEATIFYQELEIQSRDEELVRMQAHSEFVQKNLILRNVDLERQLEFLMAFYNSMNSSSDSDATNHRNNLNENKSGYYDNNVSNRDDTSRRLHSVHTSDDHLEEEDEEDVDDNDNEAEGGGCNGYDEEKKV